MIVFIDYVKCVLMKDLYLSLGCGYWVVLVDFGMKYGILWELNKCDCDVIVVFYNIIVEEILCFSLDGIMLSNGFGDLKDVLEVIEMLKDIIGKVFLFGICLGY